MRKQPEGDNEQRRAAAREARERGESPSEAGVTTGASKQQRHLGNESKSLAESALLVASELVTNAVVHARSECTLTLRADGDLLRIEVTDASAEAPAPRDIDVTSADGRGLYIVAAISTAWGVDTTPAGKQVWAEICRESRSSAS